MWQNNVQEYVRETVYKTDETGGKMWQRDMNMWGERERTTKPSEMVTIILLAGLRIPGVELI
jgi:hypothetical protein